MKKSGIFLALCVIFLAVGCSKGSSGVYGNYDSEYSADKSADSTSEKTDADNRNDDDTASDPASDTAPDSGSDSGGDTADPAFSECGSGNGMPCIDSETDIMWSSKSENVMRWEDAFIYCENLTEGGFNDWKLPSIEILLTLIQECEFPLYDERCKNVKYSKLSECLEWHSAQDGRCLRYTEDDFIWSSTDMIYGESGGDEVVRVFATGQVPYYFSPMLFKGAELKTRCARITDTERNAECPKLPENSIRTSVTAIKQTWDWEKGWIPSNSNKYGEEKSDTDCRFKCKTGYGYTGFECRKVDSSFPECVPHGQTPCVDPKSSLIWSEKTSELDHESAVKYCEDLIEGGFDDWHLPTIDELRTLIRNCDKTVIGGTCKVTERCPTYYSHCSSGGCTGCSDDDANGQYSPFGDTERIWSSTWEGDHEQKYWDVFFRRAEVYYNFQKALVRCVR